MEEKIKLVQAQLKMNHLDGWLIYNFQLRNPSGLRFLEIPDNLHHSRRFFYWIPSQGDPIKIVHRIESATLSHLPGNTLTYLSWQELQSCLEKTLGESGRIAMEYSTLPSLSFVDGGTLEMIKNCKSLEIVSSDSFLAMHTSLLSPENYASHRRAAALLESVIEKTCEHISSNFKRALTDFEVQQYMQDKITSAGCISDGPLICAAGKQSSNPHFFPSRDTASSLKVGDVLQLDIFCKEKGSKGIFADISKVVILGSQPTSRQSEIFSIVREAQKLATEFIRMRLEKNKPIKGYEVDEVCRNYIIDQGYGAFFIHRTGHNLFHEIHGPGTHLDSLETYDDRPLVKGMLFTIEPGIYLPGEFGMRLEYDLFIDASGSLNITGGIQEELIIIN